MIELTKEKWEKLLSQCHEWHELRYRDLEIISWNTIEVYDANQLERRATLTTLIKLSRTMDFVSAENEFEFRKAVEQLEQLLGKRVIIPQSPHKQFKEIVNALQHEIECVLNEADDSSTLILSIIDFGRQLYFTRRVDAKKSTPPSLDGPWHPFSPESHILAGILKSGAEDLNAWLDNRRKADLIEIVFDQHSFSVSNETYHFENMTVVPTENAKLQVLSYWQRKTQRLQQLPLQMNVAGRDIYQATQAGAMGPGAQATFNIFSQTWNQIENSVDLSKLSSELTNLRLEMIKEATDSEKIGRAS